MQIKTKEKIFRVIGGIAVASTVIGFILMLPLLPFGLIGAAILIGSAIISFAALMTADGLRHKRKENERMTAAGHPASVIESASTTGKLTKQLHTEPVQNLDNKTISLDQPQKKSRPFLKRAKEGVIGFFTFRCHKAQANDDAQKTPLLTDQETASNNKMVSPPSPIGR